VSASRPALVGRYRFGAHSLVERAARWGLVLRRPHGTRGRDEKTRPGHRTPPHAGLQTVTWLVSGEAVHHDSLGTEQLIAPGQLNLMTAGKGVSHSEEATGQYEGSLHGIQLWIAQPDATRGLAPAFEHHGELPRLEMANLGATVLVGSFEGVTSPARHDTDLVGLELVVRGPTVLPLRRDYEYAIIVLEGALLVRDELLEPGHLGYLSSGDDELFVDASPFARAMFLGVSPSRAKS